MEITNADTCCLCSCFYRVWKAKREMIRRRNRIITSSDYKRAVNLINQRQSGRVLKYFFCFRSRVQFRVPGVTYSPQFPFSLNIITYCHFVGFTGLIQYFLLFFLFINTTRINTARSPDEIRLIRMINEEINGFTFGDNELTISDIQTADDFKEFLVRILNMLKNIPYSRFSLTLFILIMLLFTYILYIACLHRELIR